MAPKKAKKAASGDLEGVLDLSDLEDTVQKWFDVKQKISEMDKVVEACKTKVEAAMKNGGATSIRTRTLTVDKRMQSRTGVSTKDLPKDVIDKYAKTSTFPVFTIKSDRATKPRWTRLPADKYAKKSWSLQHRSDKKTKSKEKK